jgi:hypothetical protein
MSDIKKLSAEVRGLSLSDALELKVAIEQRIATLALKSLSADTLNSIDDSAALGAAGTLAAKAEML